jgi:hypothetical protein
MKVELYKCKLCKSYAIAIDGDLIMECCGFSYKLVLLKSVEIEPSELAKLIH